MKKNYDFSAGKRGPVISAKPGQTQITLRLDDEVIEWFRLQVNDAGGGDYQASISAALREHVRRRSNDGLEETLRKVLREELRSTG